MIPMTFDDLRHLNNFIILFSPFSVIAIGAHGRNISLDPIEIGIRLNDVNNLNVDSVEFNELGINWKFVVERNGDFLSVFLEALDDISIYEADVSFKYVDSENNTLVERGFHKDFSNGGSKIGTSKFLSWDEYINPEYNIVVDDEARICVIIYLQNISN